MTDETARVQQGVAAGRDAVVARDIYVRYCGAGQHTAAGDTTVVAPEVAEVLARLDEIDDAMALILEVFDQALADAPPRATITQLLSLLHELVPRPGQRSPLQRVSDLAAERSTGAGQATPDDPSLLIVLRRDLYEPQEFLLSLTLFRDGQPGQPQDCGSFSGSLDQVKEFLRALVPEILFSVRGSPLIEFAVPEDLLGKNFDQWPVPSRPDGPHADDYRLGERYPVVVRDLDRTEDGKIPAGDRDLWESRWKLLLASEDQGLLREVDLQEVAELPAQAIYKWLRAAFRRDDDARGNAVLALLPPPPGKSARVGKAAIPGVIRAGCHAGMPAVIWLRHPEARKRRAAPVAAYDDDDRTYLANALNQAHPGQPALRDLPRRVQSLRLQAEADQQHPAHPGRRLSLLWANPGRSWTPPEFRVPPRSSNGADE